MPYFALRFLKLLSKLQALEIPDYAFPYHTAHRRGIWKSNCVFFNTAMKNIINLLR